MANVETINLTKAVKDLNRTVSKLVGAIEYMNKLEVAKARDARVLNVYNQSLKENDAGVSSEGP